MQRMEENNEVRTIADMIVSGKRQRLTKRDMDGLCPKGYAGTVDHPRGCPGENILKIKNSDR